MSTTMRYPFCTYFEVQVDDKVHPYFTKRLLSNRAAIYHLCVVNSINIPDLHAITTYRTLELHEINIEETTELV